MPHHILRYEGHTEKGGCVRARAHTHIDKKVKYS